jgi:hypothetical protein
MLGKQPEAAIPCFAPSFPCFSSEQGKPAKALIWFGNRTAPGTLEAGISRKSSKFPVIFPVIEISCGLKKLLRSFNVL